MRLIPVLFFVLMSALTSELPANDAGAWPELSGDGVTAAVDGRTLTLELDADTVKEGKVVLPRLCATIRSVQWRGHADAKIEIRPEQTEWTFTWKSAPADASVIEIVFDTAPLFPKDCPIATALGDGSVMLHAWQAETFGDKILFEPQWYKNTVGYWVDDKAYATWDLEVEQPGTYSIAVLQGCGKGQGGSDAVVTLSKDGKAKATLPFRTLDTGHFQNFRWIHLGMIELSEAGAYELRISVKKIAKVALFDVRNIHLVRQAQP